MNHGTTTNNPYFVGVILFSIFTLFIVYFLNKHYHLFKNKVSKIYNVDVTIIG